MAVAQPVVGERDDAAGDRDLGDLAVVAPLSKLLTTLMQQRVATQLLGRFDRRPTNQPTALLGDRSSLDRGVGLTMSRRQPAP